MVVGDASETWTWENINAAGIVFLPAAGFRVGRNGNSDVINAGSDGFYWSASSNGDNSAFGLYFDGGTVNPAFNSSRYNAGAVRLVTESK